VFPYVHGRHATDHDCVEVARLLRRVHDLPADRLVLPTPPLTDNLFDVLRPLLSHQWITDRADELVAWLDRFEAVRARARAITVPHVLSHDDLDGANVLIGDDGTVVAALDWDWARLGPREHDLWLVIDHEHPQRFLDAYRSKEVDLDPTHLEFGLLRRALGDLAARVVGEVDRPGVGTWGFERLARVDDTLALF
jgi:aminoglycoside phosphotransferase (APT) family kinase protein